MPEISGELAEAAERHGMSSLEATAYASLGHRWWIGPSKTDVDGPLVTAASAFRAA
jgi:hypothetical protein